MSVRSIYCEEVLDGKGRPNHEDLTPFKNCNILQYSEGFKGEAGNHPPFHLKGASQYVRNRKVNRVPCKVLDAPALQDDFYLNLVEWGKGNQLAVGLGSCIYLWNACNSKVTKLCELQNDIVTSVGWAADSSLLAVGCNRGQVQLWDVN